MSRQDDYNEAYEDGEKHGRRDEAERCRLLVKMRGDMARVAAKKLRADGSFSLRALWPPFKKYTRVAPTWEKAARDMDAVADAFDAVARGIALGWDPRDLDKPSPDEKIKLDTWCPECKTWTACKHSDPLGPCAACDTSCGDATSCARPRSGIGPRPWDRAIPSTDAERGQQ